MAFTIATTMLENRQSQKFGQNGQLLSMPIGC
nr:MAG TPA: hypothetical protein [Caudoviricetes sp.]